MKKVTQENTNKVLNVLFNSLKYMSLKELKELIIDIDKIFDIDLDIDLDRETVIQILKDYIVEIKKYILSLISKMERDIGYKNRINEEKKKIQIQKNMSRGMRM